MVARLNQVVFIVGAAVIAWYLMMAVHELGHVWHAWWTNAEVTRVVLYPTEISQTILAKNPKPLFVAWGGVIWGTAVPLILWCVFRRWSYAFLLRSFAAFCAIANGAYLAADAFALAGDGRDLARHAVETWQMVVPGILAMIVGLLLLNGMGRDFGIGKNARKVTSHEAAVVAIVAAALVAGMFTLAPL